MENFVFCAVKYVICIKNLHKENASFQKLNSRKKCFFFLQKCAWNVLFFKENHVKIKNTRRIHTFFCNIIEISNWLIVTLNLYVMYNCQYTFFSDPVIFVLNQGLLTSKKEEYVFSMCFCYNNNFGNTSFILAQVTLVTFHFFTDN